MRRTLAGLAALVLLAPALSAAPCRERVIEWIKEPDRTIKTVREDGRLVYQNTWIKDATGRSRELGPGPIRGTKGVGYQPSIPRKKPKPRPKPRPKPKPKPKPKPVAPSRAREVALSLEGVGYRAGGTDPRIGVNTTGLAFAFFDKMGLRVSTEMKALFRAGKFVPRTQIQPGDMVFHHANGKGHPIPNMVGIALGNHEIVYLSGSRKRVIRTSYDSPWWVQRYKGARRLLGTKLATPKGAPLNLPASKKVFQGIASFYGCGDGFDNSGTASGEVFDATKMTAAHFDLPFQTIVEVTNLKNGKKTRVRINDRGPFERENGKWVRHSTRVIDLSCRAAEVLGFRGAGLTEVRCRVID